MQIFENANYDFLRWRYFAFTASLLVILAGVAMIVTRGMPLGIDFSGGTIVIVKFEQPVSQDAVRSAVDVIPGDKGVQQYGEAGDHQVLIRLPQTHTTE